MSDGIEIIKAASEQDKKALDQLLFDVLWNPLSMPRNTRLSFKLDKTEFELAAKKNSQVIGGIVANWLSDDEIEIHHMAVKQEFQGQSVGKQLLSKLIDSIPGKRPVNVYVYARNSSIGFYEKLGFRTTGEVIMQCDLARHGISCHKMTLSISEG